MSTPQPGSRRPIAIDGNNVAFAHGNHDCYSANGLKIAFQFFNRVREKRRG